MRSGWLIAVGKLYGRITIKQREGGVMKRTSVVFVSLLLSSTMAYGHSGRTDANGCHHDRKNGGYHCHHNAEVAPMIKMEASPETKQPSSIEPASDKKLDLSPKETPSPL